MVQLLPLLSEGMHVIFYALMLVFVVFTVCIGYHWFTYGSDKNLSMLALAVFLIVSAPLFLTMSISLRALPL